MNIKQIIADLKLQRDRIDQVIAAITSLNSTGHRRVGRSPRTTQKPRRRMSTAARKKLSRLLKQRWAQGKMKPGAKRAQVSKPVRMMSRAARKKIAAAQRARWAKVKAQRKAA